MNKKLKRILAAVSLMLVFAMLFTGCSMLGGGAPAEGAEVNPTSQLISTVLPIVALVAVFYFFMIRPERKRKKEAEELRSSLSTGDPIVTIGGLTGKIVSTSEDAIVFETGEDRVRIEVKKWAISKKSK